MLRSCSRLFDLTVAIVTHPRTLMVVLSAQLGPAVVWNEIRQLCRQKMAKGGSHRCGGGARTPHGIGMSTLDDLHKTPVHADLLATLQQGPGRTPHILAHV